MKKIHPLPPEAWPETAKNLARDFQSKLEQRIQTAHPSLLRLRRFWQAQHQEGLSYREFSEVFLDRFLDSLTVRNREQYLSALATWLKFLYQRGELMAPLHQNLALRRKPSSLRPRAPLRHQQVLQLLQLPSLEQPQGLRDRAFLEMAYATGMRNRELTDLNLGDVDLADGLVHVHRTKNGCERKVPLTDWALHFLNRYLNEGRPPLTSPLSGNALWLGPRGGRMARERMGHQLRYVYLAQQTLGFRVTMHQLRHAAASELLACGANLRHIQELLGHINLNSTERYTHVTPAGLRSVHQRCHPRNNGGFS